MKAWIKWASGGVLCCGVFVPAAALAVSSQSKSSDPREEQEALDEAPLALPGHASPAPAPVAPPAWNRADDDDEDEANEVDEANEADEADEDNEVDEDNEADEDMDVAGEAMEEFDGDEVGEEGNSEMLFEAGPGEGVIELQLEDPHIMLSPREEGSEDEEETFTVTGIGGEGDFVIAGGPKGGAVRILGQKKNTRSIQVFVDGEQVTVKDGDGKVLFCNKAQGKGGEACCEMSGAAAKKTATCGGESAASCEMSGASGAKQSATCEMSGTPKKKPAKAGKKPAMKSEKAGACCGQGGDCCAEMCAQCRAKCEAICQKMMAAGCCKQPMAGAPAPFQPKAQMRMRAMPAPGMGGPQAPPRFLLRRLFQRMQGPPAPSCAPMRPRIFAYRFGGEAPGMRRGSGPERQMSPGCCEGGEVREASPVERRIEKIEKKVKPAAKKAKPAHGSV